MNWKASQDLIMLDPPRDAESKSADGPEFRRGPSSVYIACKPTSLARDLEMIRVGDIRWRRSSCVDLFPNTYHVETVAIEQNTVNRPPDMG